MTICTSTHQFQEANFNTHGYTMRHPEQPMWLMEHQLKEFWDMLLEMESSLPQLDTLRQLSFQQHPVYFHFRSS